MEGVERGERVQGAFKAAGLMVPDSSMTLGWMDGSDREA